MKALFVIPHYLRPVGAAPDGRAHGSVGRDPRPRLAALAAYLTAIREVAGPRACVLSHADRQARRLPDGPTADVVVCTVAENHLRWARSPHFLDRSAGFIGALESAATLGLLRAFDVYKPGAENMDVFEVRHRGKAYLGMVGPGP